jgi:hypothetical protein
MPELEFTVELIERDAKGAIVCGRCCEASIRVGDRFTRLWWRQYERNAATKNFDIVDSGEGPSVSLQVGEIGWYGRSIDELDPGHTAGIRFVGDGLDVLNQFDLAPDQGDQMRWSLLGERDDTG